jgi:hypothetical protein
MPTKRRGAKPAPPDPDRYATRGLTNRAWDALGNTQSSIHGPGVPSKSAVLVAMAKVVARHHEELVAALTEGTE